MLIAERQALQVNLAAFPLYSLDEPFGPIMPGTQCGQGGGRDRSFEILEKSRQKGLHPRMGQRLVR